MFELYESIGCGRSGHHAIINWIILNLTGLQIEWKYKLTYIGNSRLVLLDEGNHDIPDTFNLLKEIFNTNTILFTNYIDTPSDYTVFNQDRKFVGPLNFDMLEKHGFEYKKRVIFIRDFYNNLTSRIKANQVNLQTNILNKPFVFKTGSEFIDIWKNQARACVENKVDYLKFEDWLYDENKRKKFLNDVYGQKEIYGTKNILGTESSFGEKDKLNERYKMIDLPEDIKDLIRNDSELHYLIGALGYEYKKI
jgi:hypothetical protein